MLQLGRLAAVEPDDVRQELELLLGEVPVRSIDLPEHLASVDEQQPVGTLGRTLAAIEEHSVTGSVTV